MSSQPAPSGDGREVLPFVLEDLTVNESEQGGRWFTLSSDLEHRAAAGEKKYGTRLKTDNGRDAVVDAYEEAQDAVMYLAQAVLEEPFDGDLRSAYRTAKKLALQLADRGVL